jgi:tRNA pseudouridine38-40 synthase
VKKKRSRQQGRGWGGTRSRERNVDTRADVGEDAEREERRPKKKVACFIGYSGEGYHGMQLYLSYVDRYPDAC